MQLPPALVLGCNTPHGIGVLSDWIEEQTGFAPDFVSTNWDDFFIVSEATMSGNGFGDGLCGSSDGDGSGDGDFFSPGLEHGDGFGDGAYTGDGHGNGQGAGDGFVNGVYLGEG